MMDQIKTADALEFSDAYRAGLAMPRDIRSQKMNLLRDRMRRLKEQEGSIPSYLVAAYAGYERAETFREWGVVI